MKLYRLLATLSLGLLLLVQVPAAAFAADSSDSGQTTADASTRGPQGTIGPDAPIGPQGTVGPTGTVGTDAPTGPQGAIGPQSTTTTPSDTTDGTGTTDPADVTSSTDAAGATPDAVGTDVGTTGQTGPATTVNEGGTANNSNLTAQISNAQMALLQNLAQLDATNTSGQQAATGAVSGSDSAQLGDATSGAAMAVTNYLNLLNSMWSWATGGLNTFVENLFGNQTGDINLDPTVGATSGTGSSVGSTPTTTVNQGGTSNNSNQTTSVDNNANLTIDNAPTGSITNNITAGATSGNVGLNDDAVAGNATSGDADADVNLINLINSSIGAGQSFFGMLNVFGNLDGNILFPAGFLTAATPSQAAALAPTTVTQGGTANDSNTAANVDNLNNTTVTNAPTSTFNNNIGTTAQTGAVTANDDAVVGNTTSGNANTSSSLFNLFNTNVTGGNAVLVLVNVMGQWMGGIMDLPSTGNTGSALLTSPGTTVTQDPTANDSNTAANVDNTNNTNVTNAPIGTITNNVDASAQSGDVNATDDAQVGNLTSGNADVTSGVANLMGSTLNLSNWFGILVINVFGDWTGGVNQADTSGLGSGAVTATAVDPTTAIEAINHLVDGNTNSTSGSSTDTTQNNTTTNAVLADATTSGSTAGFAPVPNISAHAAAQTKSTGLLLEIAAGALLIAGAIGSADRRLRRRQ